MNKPKFSIGDIITSKYRHLGQDQTFMIVGYTILWGDQPFYKALSLNDNRTTHAGDTIELSQKVTNMTYTRSA
jgi:hypothetical protein